MNELIAVRAHDVLVNAVCGRELHERLEIKLQYSNWIREQIDRAELNQDIDFVAIIDNNYSPPRIKRLS
jgi:phage anti-repressor protein